MWNFLTVIEISIVKSPRKTAKGFINIYEPFKIKNLKGSYYDPSARIGLIMRTGKFLLLVGRREKDSNPLRLLSLTTG